MGFINKYITKRCIFCKGTEDVNYVPAHGIYGGWMPGHHYHESCIKQICDDPEGAGHRNIDLAIEILDRIKEYKEDVELRQKIRLRRLKHRCISSYADKA